MCGPAGGGKTTFSVELAARRGLIVVHTDDFKDAPWDDVPSLVGRRLDELRDEAAVVLEGVRALSCVHHLGLAASVDEVWWCDRFPQKEGTAGMTQRQLDLLRQMARRLPSPRCTSGRRRPG